MKVFLGGTTNDSLWRNEFIPMLTINYFNPVVDNWTPADMKKEIIERDNCDFVLYVITPKTSGVYSIAEVIDDSNKRPEKTVFVCLQKDEKEEFSISEWKSYGAVGSMVTKNGGKVFTNLKSAANFLNSRYELELSTKL